MVYGLFIYIIITSSCYKLIYIFYYYLYIYAYINIKTRDNIYSLVLFILFNYGFKYGLEFFFSRKIINFIFYLSSLLNNYLFIFLYKYIVFVQFDE